MHVVTTQPMSRCVHRLSGAAGPWPLRLTGGQRIGLGCGVLAVIVLVILGGFGVPPLGVPPPLETAVTSTSCNPPTAMPSALLMAQTAPTHALLRGGTIQASYEFEVVNYTVAANGTEVFVPTVLALFPLASGSDEVLTLHWVNLTVSGAGWSDPNQTSQSLIPTSGLSFNATVAPQLLTEGWLANDHRADAVQASAAYGNLTLAFRWLWSMTEPNATVYASGWSTPSRTANSPYLPSIFYPAPRVASQTATSPVVLGGNFTDALSGIVSGRSFNLSWSDPTGRILAEGGLNVPAGATTATANLPLAPAGHRLSPGTFVFRVVDSCGALIQDDWLSGSYPVSASLHLGIAPSSCGTIILNASVYHSGAAPSYRPSNSSYSLTSTGCTGYAFTGWSESGGLLPASQWARNTRVFVSWSGALSAGWGPAYLVTFHESGVRTGQNWSVAIHGTTVQAASPNPVTFLLANGTYPYYVGNGTGYSLVGAVSSGTVQVRGGAVNVSLTLAPDIQHVVVIVFENSNLYPTLSFAPYMDYLWNSYGRATQFYGACHESKPEYLAMTNGRAFTCDSIPVEKVSNLGDLFESHGLTWGSYLESMNTSCDTVSTPIYFAHHDPFIWYSDIVNNATRCAAHVVNSRYFNESVANGTLPNYSLYIPNTDDDCEETILPTCDAWLKGFLSPLLNSTHPAVQTLVAHTAFVLAFDEAETNLGYSTGGIVNSWCRNATGQNLSVCGGHIYLSVVSPFSSNRAYTLNATDYNLESTVEWLFGLGSDGGFDGTSNFPSMDGLFSFPQNGGY